VCQREREGGGEEGECQRKREIVGGRRREGVKERGRGRERWRERERREKEVKVETEGNN
jgi:hypothetical protein